MSFDKKVTGASQTTISNIKAGDLEKVGEIKTGLDKPTVRIVLPAIPAYASRIQNPAPQQPPAGPGVGDPAQLPPPQNQGDAPNNPPPAAGQQAQQPPAGPGVGDQAQLPPPQDQGNAGNNQPPADPVVPAGQPPAQPPEVKDSPDETLSAEEEKEEEFNEACCVTRAVKVLFVERWGRTFLITAMAIGTITTGLAFFYQFGLLQKALAFINVSIGPSASAIAIPAEVVSGVFVLLMGASVVADHFIHRKDEHIS